MVHNHSVDYMSTLWVTDCAQNVRLCTCATQYYTLKPQFFNYSSSTQQSGNIVPSKGGIRMELHVGCKNLP